MGENNAVKIPMASSKGLPSVSVVIPAYNEEIYLPLCLESIKKQDYAAEYEVIVVNNASTDNTAKIALDWGAKVVYESKRSPACARQRGVEVATGEIIAFIDADTQASPCWLSTIVSRFVQEPRTVVISGPYAYFDAGSVARIASYIGNFISITIDQIFRKVLNKGSAVWGSNFAVRRSALLEVGGFDTSIRFYGEEYELDLPSKALQTVVDSFSWQRAKVSLWYVALFFVLLWLHIGPAIEAVGRAIYVFDIGVLSTLFAYHGVNPRSWFYGKVLSNGNRNHPQIALTFDDGPNEPYTSQVLSILEQYKIKATFFIIGQNARRYPEICRRIVTTGNVIGNHSHNHHKSLCLRRSKTIAREIELAHQAIYECTGFEPKLFRPPHGFRTPWLMRTVRHLGYTVVTWDNMTGDWKADKSGEEIVRSIVQRAKPGSVIVLHDGRDSRPSYDRSQMLQALPFVIEPLKEKGFDFVTIPELLESDGESSV